MTENQGDGALGKLNQGIQESREMVQKQTMELAQDYFDDSAEALRQQIEENRAMLEGLPDQIPGRDEAFQMLFQELMDNYAAMERCINEAQGNVANLDTERLRKQGAVDATDAARREAREQNLDLTEIEGTGSEGRVIADDVKNSVQWEEGLAVEGVRATDAARREAQERDVDLSNVEGTGADGNIVVDDVTNLAESPGEQSTPGAGQAAREAQNTAGQTTQQAQEVIGQTTGRIGDVASQMQSTAGGALQQTQSVAGGATGQINTASREAGSSKATGSARRRAEKQGVDLSSVEGTGPGGLITLKDVMDS